MDRPFIGISGLKKNGLGQCRQKQRDIPHSVWSEHRSSCPDSTWTLLRGNAPGLFALTIQMARVVVLDCSNGKV